MSGQVCTYNDYLHTQAKKKEKKQAILTVLGGDIVEAQRLPERFQLHVQNWTFHIMGR
jgi:hypothetical protein